MFALLCILTGATLTLAALAAYVRWHDALHPAIVVAPTFGYTMSVWPLLLNATGGLDAYFDEGQLVHIQLVHFLSIACFCLGLFTKSFKPGLVSADRATIGVLTANGRRRLYEVAVLLGVLSLGSYLYAIERAGGFVQAFSFAKGGGDPTVSGYIGEAILFSFPSVLAIAIARRAGGGRLFPVDIVLSFVFLSPQLLQGILGGRRGPLFLCIATLFFSWFIARNRRPSLPMIVLGIGLAGLGGLFVFSQRHEVYLGSGNDVELSRLEEVLLPQTVDPGDTFVTGGAYMLSADFYGKFYWGYRYFVTFFIRPIPRQLWPTKYEDMGATWVLGMSDQNEERERTSLAGFTTVAGSAMTSVADAYLEFAWGVLPLFFLVGCTFAKSWSLHRERGGEWTIIFSVMLALSVYLASQSFSAWAIRLLFIGLPVTFLWKNWVCGDSHLRWAKERFRSIAKPDGPVAHPVLLGVRSHSSSRSRTASKFRSFRRHG